MYNASHSTVVFYMLRPIWGPYQGETHLQKTHITYMSSQTAAREYIYIYTYIYT